MCIRTVYTRRRPQIWSWSCELSDVGPTKQTPVWSSAGRTRTLNCGSISLVNFLSSPFLPSLCSLLFLLLPRLISKAGANVTSELSSWRSQDYAQHHTCPFPFYTWDRRTPRDTVNKQRKWRVKNPRTEWLQCPSQFSALQHSLLKVHTSLSRRALDLVGSGEVIQ